MASPRASALSGYKVESAPAEWSAPGLTMQEQPFSTKILLTGAIDASGVAISAATGAALPRRVGPILGDDIKVTMLAPDKLLFLESRASERQPPDLIERLRAEAGVYAFDVSDGFQEIALRGDKIEQVLGAGTSANLSEQAFPVASAMQTQMAGIRALVCRWSATEYSLFIDSSIARCTWQWLTRVGSLVSRASGAPGVVPEARIHGRST